MMSYFHTVSCDCYSYVFVVFISLFILKPEERKRKKKKNQAMSRPDWWICFVVACFLLMRTLCGFMTSVNKIEMLRSSCNW